MTLDVYTDTVHWMCGLHCVEASGQLWLSSTVSDLPSAQQLALPTLTDLFVHPASASFSTQVSTPVQQVL